MNTSYAVREADRDPEFARWIANTIGGEKMRHCLQCGLCSGTCPLSEYMDHTPRQLVLLAATGFKNEVLSSRSLWLCTSCYGCVAKCPKQINLTDVMYALKQRALEEKRYPRFLSVPAMALAFAKTVRSRGRINEAWLMASVFFKTLSFRMFGMSSAALKLLKAGRLPLWPESIKGRAELSVLLDTVAVAKKESL